ncbi:hypothetical protein N8Z75_02045 [Crocinitomicaceae bacterium]|nr:hypothetical protein [Crocinitomicaceae bacterium]
MSETEDLKEWIKIHFSDYDKSRFDLYMKEKKAYNDGIATFDSMQYELSPELKIELRHESGLMEVARQRGLLFEYGYHCYRQIELIFARFFELKPGRINAGDFLLGSDAIQLNNHYGNNNRNDALTLVSIVNPTVIRKLNYNESLGAPRYRYCFVRKLNNYEWRHSNSYWKPKNNDIKLNFKDKERLYKCIMFFNPFAQPNPKNNKSNPASGFSWPNLNAFEIIYHSRNKHAHLGVKNSDLESVYNDSKLNLSITPEEKNYIDDPNLILSSDYFKRYVNMVIGLYSELYKVNYDLSAYHS